MYSDNEEKGGYCDNEEKEMKDDSSKNELQVQNTNIYYKLLYSSEKKHKEMPYRLNNTCSNVNKLTLASPDSSSTDVWK